MPWCRRQGVRSTLATLHQQGYQLGVFSDYPAQEKLRALGIDQYFTAVISSHDHGVQGFKPDTNGFTLAAERLHLLPEEVLYVGDREEVDAQGACAAGMQAAIITPGREPTSTDSYFTFPSFGQLHKILAELTTTQKGM